MGSSDGVETKKKIKTVKHLSTSAISSPRTPEGLWRARAQATPLRLAVARTGREQ